MRRRDREMDKLLQPQLLPRHLLRFLDRHSRSEHHRSKPALNVSAALVAFHRGDRAAGKRLLRRKDQFVTVADLLTLRELIIGKMHPLPKPPIDLIGSSRAALDALLCRKRAATALLARYQADVQLPRRAPIYPSRTRKKNSNRP